MRALYINQPSACTVVLMTHGHMGAPRGLEGHAKGSRRAAGGAHRVRQRCGQDAREGGGGCDRMGLVRAACALQTSVPGTSVRECISLYMSSLVQEPRGGEGKGGEGEGTGTPLQRVCPGLSR
jgi:hypothetical protein